MAVPWPGQYRHALDMLVDLQSTGFLLHSLHGLLMAEEVHRRGLEDRINSEGSFSGERHSDAMRVI